MIEIQTIRFKDSRRIIKIKGILPKDKLPPEYTSNKSGQKCAFWMKIVDGKEVVVLRGLGYPLWHIVFHPDHASILPGDTICEGDRLDSVTFQRIIQFMHRAGNRLHNINTSKKLGIGIKETVRI